MVGKVFMHGGNKAMTVPIYIKKKLDDNSWQTISECAKSGNAANYWEIGDCKAIYVKGNIGMLDIDESFYVYIIGFNHNSDQDPSAINTIDFGTFKDIETGRSICLADAAQANQPTSGMPYFNIYHYGKNGTYGGWKGSDLRYDVLGSTDVAPSGYGSVISTNRVGYDATETCAINPVSNTFMSALPSDLRDVMKPMYVWSDNVCGAVAIKPVASNITKSIDYLPLMSEFEILGKTVLANDAEKNYQKQYQYYISNGKIKYHYGTLDRSYWLTRSIDQFLGNVCAINTNEGVYPLNVITSQGLAPIFRVG